MEGDRLCQQKQEQHGIKEVTVRVNFSLMLCKAKHSCNQTFPRDFHGVPLQTLHLFCAHVGSTMHFPSWEPI